MTTDTKPTAEEAAVAVETVIDRVNENHDWPLSVDVLKQAADMLRSMSRELAEVKAENMRLISQGRDCHQCGDSCKHCRSLREQLETARGLLQEWRLNGDRMNLRCDKGSLMERTNTALLSPASPRPEPILTDAFREAADMESRTPITAGNAAAFLGMKPTLNEPRKHAIGEAAAQTPEKNDSARGLYQKYHVERTDGSSGPGGKHDGCEYFVLDLTHDKYAADAIAAYAAACKGEFPVLAADLEAKLPGLGWIKPSAQIQKDVVINPCGSEPGWGSTCKTPAPVPAVEPIVGGDLYDSFMETVENDPMTDWRALRHWNALSDVIHQHYQPQTVDPREALRRKIKRVDFGKYLTVLELDGTAVDITFMQTAWNWHVAGHEHGFDADRKMDAIRAAEEYLIDEALKGANHAD